MIVQSCQNNIILFYPPKGFEAVTFEMKGMNNNIFKNPSQANDRINTVNIHCKHNFIVGKNALWCQFNALISMWIPNISFQEFRYDIYINQV